MPGLYAAAALLVVASPLKWPCPIAAIFGVPCPTCGMTRATRLALHGEIARATAMHPLVWIVVPFVGGMFALEALGYLRTGAWGATARVRWAQRLLVAVAALVFVVWIARFLGAFGGPVPVH